MAKKAAKKAVKKTAKKAVKKTAARRPAAATKAVARRSPAKKSGAKKSARKPNAAFMAPVTPSADLATVVGSTPIPRTEITKRVWAYIKKNNLQDPKNRRMINADSTLKPIFGGKGSVSMFEMTKLVNNHLS